METTLSGSHNGHQHVLEVSSETWDRFRDWRTRLGSTIGQLLAEIAETRQDTTAVLNEADVTRYLDSLDSCTSCAPGGEGGIVAPNTA